MLNGMEIFIPINMISEQAKSIEDENISEQAKSIED